MVFMWARFSPFISPVMQRVSHLLFLDRGETGSLRLLMGALVGGVELSFDIPDFNAHGSDIFRGLVGGTGYNAKMKWLAALTPRAATP